MNISKNTVLITGGASGIGFAFAKKFLEFNNTVIILGRNAEKLEQAKSAFPDVITYQCDLNNTTQVDQLAVLFENEYRNVNILVNNAGIQYNYHFLEEPNTRFKVEQEIGINLIAPLRLTSLFLPLLVQQESAAIINVSSGLGFVPKESAPVYCAAKAGLHIFSKALRYQLEASSVKVFEMIPPLVDTNMTKGRGNGKMSPDAVIEEFWEQFRRDRFEVMIGKVKVLRLLHRFLPGVAEKIVRYK